MTELEFNQRKSQFLHFFADKTAVKAHDNHIRRVSFVQITTSDLFIVFNSFYDR
jgi:hypothetical protein